MGKMNIMIPDTLSGVGFMVLDYEMIGKRIAQRRKQLRLTQGQTAERADISDRYLSNIERARSIPSTQVIMSLAAALETTPDEFLVGSARHEGDRWRTVAERLRGMSDSQLDLIEDFAAWVAERR